MGLFKKSSVSKDFVNLVRAYDNGEEWAKKALNDLWHANKVGSSDVDEARIIIHEKAAMQGDKRAQYLYGMSLRHADPQQSLKLLLGLAHQGDVEAMKAIAGGYTDYGGYGDNEQQFLYWMMAAANLGDAEAQYRVGLQLGVFEDKAWEWFVKAAKQGYVAAVLKAAEHLCNKAVMVDRTLPDCIEKQRKYYDDAEIILLEVADGEYENCLVDQAATAFEQLGRIHITTVNDLLWFEDDFIFEQLGIEIAYAYPCSKGLGI